MKIKKVLVVDDNRDIQQTFLKVLEYLIKDVEVLQAYTVKEAREFFAENTDIGLIVVVVQLSSESLIENIALTKKFRKTFKGPIVAASFFSEFNEKLMKAGCDYQVQKEDILSTLKKILK